MSYSRINMVYIDIVMMRNNVEVALHLHIIRSLFSPVVKVTHVQCKIKEYNLTIILLYCLTSTSLVFC